MEDPTSTVIHPGAHTKRQESIFHSPCPSAVSMTQRNSKKLKKTSIKYNRSFDNGSQCTNSIFKIKQTRKLQTKTWTEIKSLLDKNKEALEKIM